MARDKFHHRHATPEERSFFESLVSLRATYGSRGSADAEPVMSVRHAIAAANAAMMQVVSPRVTHLGIAAN